MAPLDKVCVHALVQPGLHALRKCPHCYRQAMGLSPCR